MRKKFSLKNYRELECIEEKESEDVTKTKLDHSDQENITENEYINYAEEPEIPKKNLSKEIDNHRLIFNKVNEKSELANQEDEEELIKLSLKEQEIQLEKELKGEEKKNPNHRGNKNNSNNNQVQKFDCDVNYILSLANEKQRVIQHHQKLKALSENCEKEGKSVPLGIIDGKLNIGFSKTRLERIEKAYSSVNTTEASGVEEFEEDKYKNEIDNTNNKNDLSDDSFEKLKLSAQKKEVKEFFAKSNRSKKFEERVKKNKESLEGLNILNINENEKNMTWKEKNNLDNEKKYIDLYKGDKVKMKKYVPFQKSLSQVQKKGSFLEFVKKDKKNGNKTQDKKIKNQI